MFDQKQSKGATVHEELKLSEQLECLLLQSRTQLAQVTELNEALQAELLHVRADLHQWKQQARRFKQGKHEAKQQVKFIRRLLDKQQHLWQQSQLDSADLYAFASQTLSLKEQFLVKASSQMAQVDKL